MKTYRVAVGDKEYIVKVEEVAEGTVVQETVASAPAASADVVAGGDAEIIEAPLQGLILSVNVKPGDAVKTGDTVLIIEAMKLENEVVAPQDGVIQQVFVTQGQTVDAEDALYSIA
ncbi:MAG TPA: biotin/lipoyl-binding protein [Clostridiaceae bacterium]|nr:biotin/lipoyl-binding protein [Clostridiaceae bacterium]